MGQIALVLAVSLFSALCYRLGGRERGNRLFRLLGCPLLCLGLFWGLKGLSLAYWKAYLLTFGLMVGAISAYWGQDEKRWGYLLHGLGISLAVLPLAFTAGHWLGFLARTVVLTAGITVWSEYTSQAEIEEGGRGFLMAASIPLLLL